MPYQKTDLVPLLDKALKNDTETQDIEFKDGRGGEVHSGLWKSISSFSHSPDGGIIFFGVSRDKNNEHVITGGLDLASLQEKLSDYFSNMMTNALPPEMHIVEYKNHSLLAVIVKSVPKERRPCHLTSKGMPGGACIRSGNTDKVLSLEEMKQMLRDSSLFKFDKSPLEQELANELSLKKIASFFKESARKAGRERKPGEMENVTSQMMQNAHIITQSNTGRGFVPTVAGFLIFADKDPLLEGDNIRYQIRCVRYSGTSPGSDILDRADISGTLDQQIDLARSFILRNIQVPAKLSGTKLVDEYEYPPEALRELVANAVIHRDYEIIETYTKIEIFSDRIEITNPGTLPPGITIQNLKNDQFSRNSVISQILKDMSYIEEYGRGIDLVYDRMAERGYLEPVFRNISNCFKVTLLGSRYASLNERQIDAWSSLQRHGSGTITSNQYAELFSISTQSANADIAEMVDLGLFSKKREGRHIFYELN